MTSRFRVYFVDGGELAYSVDVAADGSRPTSQVVSEALSLAAQRGVIRESERSAALYDARTITPAAAGAEIMDSYEGDAYDPAFFVPLKDYFDALEAQGRNTRGRPSILLPKSAAGGFHQVVIVRKPTNPAVADTGSVSAPPVASVVPREGGREISAVVKRQPQEAGHGHLPSGRRPVPAGTSSFALADSLGLVGKRCPADQMQPAAHLLYQPSVASAFGRWIDSQEFESSRFFGGDPAAGVRLAFSAVAIADFFAMLFGGYRDEVRKRSEFRELVSSAAFSRWSQDILSAKSDSAFAAAVSAVFDHFSKSKSNISSRLTPVAEKKGTARQDDGETQGYPRAVHTSVRAASAATMVRVVSGMAAAEDPFLFFKLCFPGIPNADMVLAGLVGRCCRTNKARQKKGGSSEQFSVAVCCSLRQCMFVAVEHCNHRIRGWYTPLAQLTWCDMRDPAFFLLLMALTCPAHWIGGEITHNHLEGLLSDWELTETLVSGGRHRDGLYAVRPPADAAVPSASLSLAAELILSPESRKLDLHQMIGSEMHCPRVREVYEEKIVVDGLAVNAMVIAHGSISLCQLVSPTDELSLCTLIPFLNRALVAGHHAGAVHGSLRTADIFVSLTPDGRLADCCAVGWGGARSEFSDFEKLSDSLFFTSDRLMFQIMDSPVCLPDPLPIDDFSSLYFVCIDILSGNQLLPQLREAIQQSLPPQSTFVDALERLMIFRRQFVDAVFSSLPRPMQACLEPLRRCFLPESAWLRADVS